jgi:hypothetical protein
VDDPDAVRVVLRIPEDPSALSFLLMASVLVLVFLYVRRAGTDDLV